MKRRDLIKLVTLATGSMLSVPLLNSLLVSCESNSTITAETYELQFFNREDFKLIQELVDIILPRTDSPSATDVGVHKTIDTMIAQVYSPQQKSDYKNQFSAFKKQIENTNESWEIIMKQLLSSEESDAKKGLNELRNQTIAYYLSTEEVSKKHLNYLPVPGDYEPCIELNSVKGKAWAI